MNNRDNPQTRMSLRNANYCTSTSDYPLGTVDSPQGETRRSLTMNIHLHLELICVLRNKALSLIYLTFSWYVD